MNRTMYKISQSTGKTQVWSARSEGDTIIVEHGELGGKLQTQTTVAEPKNISRSNATTAEEQAVLEVTALYEDRYSNKHYRDTIEEAKLLAEDCKIPRMVHKYQDHGDKLPDELYVSAKEDGSRACVINGVLFSKAGRKEEVKVEHLRKALEVLGDVSFDAEVYAEGLTLQRIRSAWLKPVRTDKEVIKVANERCKKKGTPKVTTVEEAVEYLGYHPNEDALKLKFHVFDIPVTGVPFKERIKLFRELNNTLKVNEVSDCFGFLYPKLMTKQRAQDFHRGVVIAGHEGVVYYSPEDMYEFGKRSYTCLKSKFRIDSEALITGVEKCKNGDGKLLLTACDELDNVTFTGMMKVNQKDGTKQPRDFETMETLIGQWVTFSYEALSDAGKPQKPVVECLRKCDDVGQPLE